MDLHISELVEEKRRRTQSDEDYIFETYEEKDSFISDKVQDAEEQVEGEEIQLDKQDDDILDLSELSADQIEQGRPAEQILPAPKYIGMDHKFENIRKDDGKHMRFVRGKLANYHRVAENMRVIGYEKRVAEALGDLIKACDKYCFWRFRLLTFGVGKQQLLEIRELRRQAKALKHQVLVAQELGWGQIAGREADWRLGKKEKNDTEDYMRSQLIVENRRRNLDLDKLRLKTTYKLKKLSASQQKNNTASILARQKVKSVREAIKEVMPGAYNDIDQALTDQDSEEKELDLVHSEGTKLLQQGHDVLEFDVAGSTFETFRAEHKGLHGKNKTDKTKGVQEGIYGEKVDEKGLVWKKEKSYDVKGENARTAKKVRFSMAGPENLDGGKGNERSIASIRKRILENGVARLKPVFKAWKQQEENGEKPDFHKIDLMFRGHSRGGVAASHGAMRLKYWVLSKYPEYMKYLSFKLIQIDPVPGKDVEFRVDNVDRIDVRDYQGQNGSVFELDGEKMAALGEESETTVLYSMVNQDDWTHRNLFHPQEVRHAKRLVLMPFSHDLHLDLEHIDTSQMEDDEEEKAHSMAFINAEDRKVYRGSGLNRLGEGVYIMDENHVMVKVDSLAQLQGILMRIMPDQFVERRARILRAAASILNDRDRMDEYASIDHQRNLRLAEAIGRENEKKREYVTPVKKKIKLLQDKLKTKPSDATADKVLLAYSKAIKSCGECIKKMDVIEAERESSMLDEAKQMYSALLREMDIFAKKILQMEGREKFSSWNEMFMQPVNIRRGESQVKEIEAKDDLPGDREFRIQKGDSVAFFKEMDKAKAKSAAVMSELAEAVGFQKLFRPATEAKIEGDDENGEISGIVCEQIYDTSYDDLKKKDGRYVRKNTKIVPTDLVQEKYVQIIAFDVLFGIHDRLNNDHSSLKVLMQRHADKKTSKIAKSGDLSAVKDTYSIVDICADIVESPLFDDRKADQLRQLDEFDRKAIKTMHKNARTILKGLKEQDIKEKVGAKLSKNQLEVLLERLKAIQKAL